MIRWEKRKNIYIWKNCKYEYMEGRKGLRTCCAGKLVHEPKSTSETPYSPGFTATQQNKDPHPL